MEDSDSATSFTRRGVLRAGAGTAVGLTALQATAPASAQTDAYGGYLEDEGTWGGETADASGQDEVTVQVGVQGNNGPNAFGPAALYVDPGTTITWSWTGNGGHNVIGEGDEESFIDSREETDSDIPRSPEATYQVTFEDEGVYQYYCQPHKPLGMKGVVVVGEDNVETATFPYGEEEEEFGLAAAAAGTATFGVISLLGVAAYRELLGDSTE
jgi:halocyanin-like protein